MKVHKRSGGIASVTLNLGSKWRWIYVYLCMRLNKTECKECRKYSCVLKDAAECMTLCMLARKFHGASCAILHNKSQIGGIESVGSLVR